MKSIFHSLLILLVCSGFLYGQGPDYQLEVLDLNTTQDSKADISASFTTPNGIYYYLETEDSYDELHFFDGSSVQMVFRQRSADIRFVADFNDGALFSIDPSSPDGYAIFINDLDGSVINLPISSGIDRADFVDVTQRLVFLTDSQLFGSINGRDNLVDTISTDMDSPRGSLAKYAATSQQVVYQSGYDVISTDGTSTNVDTILELEPFGNPISELVVSGEKIYFSSNSGLFVTDASLGSVFQLCSDTEMAGLITVSNIGKLYPFKGGMPLREYLPLKGGNYSSQMEHLKELG